MCVCVGGGGELRRRVRRHTNQHEKHEEHPRKYENVKHPEKHKNVLLGKLSKHTSKATPNLQWAASVLINWRGGVQPWLLNIQIPLTDR